MNFEWPDISDDGFTLAVLFVLASVILGLLLLVDVRFVIVGLPIWGLWAVSGYGLARLLWRKR